MIPYKVETQTCWLTILTPSQKASDVNYKHKTLLKNYNFVALISFVLYIFLTYRNTVDSIF
jgi:hypothetical protein